MDERTLVLAISGVLKRLADKGWVKSTTVTSGKLAVEYTELGKTRMRVFKDIFINELSLALDGDQFQGLMALLLMFEKNPKEK